MTSAVRDALANPVVSIRVPFTRDGELDHRGLWNYVERVLEGRPGAVLLTYGDSLYSLLTDAEVADVTRAVVDQVAGRALVVGADRSWWTGRAVEFARFCREAGADLVMVLPPDWAQSSTPESLAGHYQAVAAELPVMMVTTFLRDRPQAVALSVVEEVFRSAPGVIALKEDVGGVVGQRVTAAVSSRWTVVAGGSKRLHLSLLPYGCHGYLSTLLVFKPRVTQEYWHACQAGDLARMAALVREVDVPMFDTLSGCPGGFDAGLHGWCELLGTYGRWRRGPYRSLTEAELDQLADELRTLGLLDT